MVARLVDALTVAKTNVALGWAGVLRGGEAVYTSQDEAAVTELLRRWPRK